MTRSRKRGDGRDKAQQGDGNGQSCPGVIQASAGGVAVYEGTEETLLGGKTHTTRCGFCVRQPTSALVPASVAFQVQGQKALCP